MRRCLRLYDLRYIGAAWHEAERRMDKLRRLLDQGDVVYKYDSGWHRDFGGCQGERKAGASKSNQGASHRNKNRLASRRRRGMRIREGETRQNVEKRDGLVFCSGWMDGTFVHAAEWMDGAHEPPPAPGKALCCCQGSTAENFLFFFFASHECARGCQRRYVGVKQGDGERVNEEAESVLDPRSAKSAAAQQPRLVPVATLTGTYQQPPLLQSHHSSIKSLALLPHHPGYGPRVLETHNGDASMAPRAVDRLRLLHVLAPRPLPVEASANARAQRLSTEPVAAGGRSGQLPYAA